MKRYYSLLIMVVLCLCLLTSITQSASSAVATKYGYAMFRDADGDKITSDIGEQYIDCNIRGAGGEDLIQININNNDGSLNWVEFYPGKMVYHYPKYPPSTRTVHFNFDVAGTVEQGWQDGIHEAVHEILRWKDGNTPPIERNTTSPGFLNEGGLHVPIMINTNNRNSSFPFDDVIQFAIEPDVIHHGGDGSVTIQTVDAFYDDGSALNTSSYFCTAGATGTEPEPYIIYQIVFGSVTNGVINSVDGFDINAIARDPKTKKPITWRITPKPNVNMILCVGTPNYTGNWSTWGGQWIPLTAYTAITNKAALSFELIVSLAPIKAYGAPAKYVSAPTLWGEVKGK